MDFCSRLFFLFCIMSYATVHLGQQLDVGLRKRELKEGVKVGGTEVVNGFGDSFRVIAQGGGYGVECIELSTQFEWGRKGGALLHSMKGSSCMMGDVGSGVGMSV